MTSQSADRVPAHTDAPAPAPVAVHRGDRSAPRTAAVLSPVMAQWDEGAFLDPVARALTADHRVTVYDTLSLLREGDDLAALAGRWAEVLGAEEPDLLVGNALGGAVVQHLLGHPWARRTRVLLLSAPTVADGPLDATLERVAAAVSSHGTATALRLLHEAVRGPADAPAAEGSRPLHDEPSAGRRLAAGLRLLRHADARHHVEAFPGSLLHVYGTASRLVQRHHLATGPGHSCAGIPEAGMRPHADRPQATRRVMRTFLDRPRTEKDT